MPHHHIPPRERRSSTPRRSGEERRSSRRVQVRVVESAFWLLLLLVSGVHAITILLAYQSTEGLNRFVVAALTAILPGLSELWWAGVTFVNSLPDSNWFQAATHWYVLLVLASGLAVILGGPMLFYRTHDRRRWHDRRQRKLLSMELPEIAESE